MKIIDYIKLDKKELFNKLQIVFTTILALFLLLLLNFRFNFINYINNSIINNPWFRVLVVGANLDKKNNGLDELQNIENIDLIYSSQYDYATLESSYKNDMYDGFIDLNYGDKSLLPKNIIGSTINENDHGVALCPSNFYPSSDANNLAMDFEFLDTEKLIGSTFSIKYYSYKDINNQITIDQTFTKDFKIIGLYNNKDLMLPSNNCFISSKDMKEIIDTGTLVNDGVYGFTLVVNKTENVNKVINELEKLKFNYSIKIEYDTSLINKIINISNVIIVFIIILILIININFLKKRLIQNSNSIGILLTLGFSKHLVNLIYLCQIFINNMISYLIAIMLSFISHITIKKVFRKLTLLIAYNIEYNYIMIITGFFFIILMPCLYYLFYIQRKINKNIVNLVRNEE